MENIVRFVAYILVILLLGLLAGSYEHRRAIEYWFEVGTSIFSVSLVLGVFLFIVYNLLTRHVAKSGGDKRAMHQLFLSKKALGFALSGAVLFAATATWYEYSWFVEIAKGWQGSKIPRGTGVWDFRSSMLDPSRLSQHDDALRNLRITALKTGATGGLVAWVLGPLLHSYMRERIVEAKT